MDPESQELQLRRAGVPWENLFRDIGVSGSTGTQERRGWHRLEGYGSCVIFEDGRLGLFRLNSPAGLHSSLEKRPSERGLTKSCGHFLLPRRMRIIWSTTGGAKIASVGGVKNIISPRSLAGKPFAWFRATPNRRGGKKHH